MKKLMNFGFLPAAVGYVILQFAGIGITPVYQGELDTLSSLEEANLVMYYIMFYLLIIIFLAAVVLFFVGLVSFLIEKIKPMIEKHKSKTEVEESKPKEK